MGLRVNEILLHVNDSVKVAVGDSGVAVVSETMLTPMFSLAFMLVNAVVSSIPSIDRNELVVKYASFPFLVDLTTKLGAIVTLGTVLDTDNCRCIAHKITEEILKAMCDYKSVSPWAGMTRTQMVELARSEHHDNGPRLNDRESLRVFLLRFIATSISRAPPHRLTTDSLFTKFMAMSHRQVVKETPLVHFVYQVRSKISAEDRISHFADIQLVSNHDAHAHMVELLADRAQVQQMVANAKARVRAAQRTAI